MINSDYTGSHWDDTDRDTRRDVISTIEHVLKGEAVDAEGRLIYPLKHPDKITGDP